VTVRGVGAVNSSTPLDSHSPAIPQLENQQMSSMVTVPGSRKRASNQTPDTFDVEDTNARKKLRQEDHGSNTDTERTLREEALTREVEKLRKELEKAQMEKDVLISVISQLTQRPK
jgi:DNA-binding transcriptional regulator GbsR (MarR family)